MRCKRKFREIYESVGFCEVKKDEKGDEYETDAQDWFPDDCEVEDE